MADLSLGPLRIANPDGSSPDLTPEPSISSRTTAAVSPLNPMMDNEYLSYDRRQDPISVSPLENPSQGYYQPESAAATTTTTTTTSTTAPTALSQEYHIARKEKQSIPYNYQDQQQPQYTQYSSILPQNSQVALNSAPRPVSSYYSPATTNGNTSNGLNRENSYRVRSDSTRSTLQRTNSRGSAIALQAGVPTRDGNHVERSYKQPQYTTGNGPVPPRKTSRAPGATSAAATPPNGNTPLSSTAALSSSYAEGGPLSSSEEWKERGAAVGVQQEYDANGKPVSRFVKKGVKDFIFGQTLGEGSYSTVLAATDRQTLKEYAIKVLDKRHIIKEKKVKYVNIERDTLNRLTDHPGVVRLYYTFQDERSLYFVLDLCSGGELLGVLKRMTTFDEECTSFYAAQILDTIEYMHRRGVIHRDLKPENVLLDEKMHIKITDFGTAKILDIAKPANGGSDFNPDTGSNDNRASSFVGTAEYVSPELLTDKNACKASDLWAFGCIVYQLLAGRPPFKAGNEYQTFQKIVALDYEFPRGFPEVARDLVERLLVLDPQRRLSIEHVKNHQFFDGITWGRGLWQHKAPRLKNYVPPTVEPIKLNESADTDSYPPDISPVHNTASTHLIPADPTPRLQPRIITELPPPSQLDIEWSPVLTRTNERILKLGNMSVVSSNNHSPHNGEGGGGGGKLSRFFGGNASKKRQRLVMVTSSARIIIAAAGGDEKKSKLEISLLQPGCQFSSSTDAKGLTHWFVDTGDKHLVFEDPKSSANDPTTTSTSTQDWLEALDRAKELARSQRVQHSYSGEDSFSPSSSALSSHASTLDRTSSLSPSSASTHTTRATLHKPQSAVDSESIKGRKRFSKRQSKSGLAAVF